nr:RHS repeat-associated core domain-containing protein [Erwinia sorbitola]
MPQALSDREGNTVWRPLHTGLFGVIRREESRLSPYAARQNLRFAGQYYDEETGLHYNTLRYYDPGSGSFTQPDPIGLAGGINLYAYGPNPLTWIDPLGLRCGDLKNKDPGKNGIEIERLTTKKGTTKVDTLFNNMNDAKNWASNTLGLGKTRMYDSNGKWIGWQNNTGDSFYWGHGDWGQGVGKSTFPHLNININGEKGHLFLKGKIINRGQWDDFAKFFE